MVIEISLTKGQTTIIDDVDSDLAQYKWYAHPVSKYQPNIYYACNRKYGMMHRLILERLVDKKMTLDEQTDHINGNTLDNQRVNLRISTCSQNQMNKKVQDKKIHSVYKGVSKHYDKWRAYIKIQDKQIHIGRFKSEIDAARAYDRKAIELFGEYAKTNFPREEYEEITG